MYQPKECIEYDKSISYKNWAIHLRTDNHLSNVARCKIMIERKLEAEAAERVKQEHLLTAKKYNETWYT